MYQNGIVRRYLRDGKRNPRALACAKVFENDNLISVGFSACAKNDVFNYKLASLIGLGRLNSKRYHINLSEYLTNTTRENWEAQTSPLAHSFVDPNTLTFSRFVDDFLKNVCKIKKSAQYVEIFKFVIKESVQKHMWNKSHPIGK